VTERGILTETPAILAFVAQSFPAAGLAPLDDSLEFARVQAFNSYLCSTVHVAHAHRLRGYRWADDPAAIADMQRKVPTTVGDCFELIETTMLKGPWVMATATASAIRICSRCRNGSTDGVDEAPSETRRLAETHEREACGATRSRRKSLNYLVVALAYARKAARPTVPPADRSGPRCGRTAVVIRAISSTTDGDAQCLAQPDVVDAVADHERRPSAPK
jgi:hypothetical protein